MDTDAVAVDAAAAVEEMDVPAARHADPEAEAEPETPPKTAAADLVIRQLPEQIASPMLTPQRRSAAAEGELLEMPMVPAGSVDSMLLLPIERDVMWCTIDRVAKRQDGVWTYRVVVETSLAMYADPKTPSPTGAPDRTLGRGDLAPSSESPVKMTRVSRYSHFDWLRGALLAEFPHLVIPPIPPKDFVVVTDRAFGFGDDDEDEGAPPLPVQERQRGLAYFLNALAAHKTLRRSTLLREFLTCESDASYSALKDSTAAAQAATRAAKSSASDAIRNIGFQTKSAFSWLKNKVTGKAAAASAVPATPPEHEKLAAYLATIETSANELIAETEAHYLRCIDQAMTPSLGYTAPETDWGERLAKDEDLVVNARIQMKNGQFGTIRWVGKIRKMPYPDAVHAGIEWDKAHVGTSDGSAFGERYFQGKNGPRGCSFVPAQQLYVPLPRDSVVDALDNTTAVLDAMLEDLPPAQEKRLFYIMSDLQVLKGWTDTVKKPMAYLQGQSLTLASLQDSLQQLQAQKREDVNDELDMADRIKGIENALLEEKAAFRGDLDRLKRTVGALYRGMMLNYVTFNAYCEARVGVDSAILKAADGIDCVWDDSGRRAENAED
eukprot:TRINITY_DN6463_c0_g1_i1.p1 TRINITY_DN6463_c0_g1~~TRINITY_DN6463_c0_g1_i1.p1  ORF type:complete len:627 (+),score=207.53 TRINITY_DN6463_c0_g1_i1:59-1882(+)